ncbi:DNA/RNA non-specific endonuclease [Acetivibrio ethanolgignens]|uniref:DNA/RNA non-specific endonuclease n=1 Tax=Acetivibrio ethanolgignens TaxID=290052 RepID=UPI000A5F3FC0|nr:DNA/RNA non-specific endonuclease [Acetivibrio ethanolgignens]
MNKKFNRTRGIIITATLILMLILVSCGSSNPDSQVPVPTVEVDEIQAESKADTEADFSGQEDNKVSQSGAAVAVEDEPDTKKTEDGEKNSGNKPEKDTFQYKGKAYKIIEVDGGDLSGSREPNVAVDIGFGDRIYWALTNKYGQLVYVIADEIILQDDENESVTSSGRYYADEAKVPGVEKADFDEGHIIADSLGGVSNAYNITPQNSTLNRHGNQAYMEKVIRDAGGCEDFVATITYPDTTTQIPSKYK